MSQAMVTSKLILRCGLGLGAILGLSACAQHASKPLARVDYETLQTLRLNVARVSVIDDTSRHPVAGDIAYQAPVPPVTTLRHMVEHTILPSGSNGAATVTIMRASIQHAPVSTLIGQLSVRVNVTSPNSNAAGYVVVNVNRTSYTGDTPANSPQELSNMSVAMTQDMNNALDKRIKTDLGDWLVDASGLPVRHEVQQSALPSGTDQPDGQVKSTIPAVSPALTIVHPPTKKPATDVRSSSSHDEAPDAVFPLGNDDMSTTDQRTNGSISSPPHNLSLPSQ